MGFRVKELGGQVGGRFLISWDLGNGGSSGLISQTGSQHALLDPQASCSPPSPGLGHLPPTCEWLQCFQGERQSLSSHCVPIGWQVPNTSQAVTQALEAPG